jgi:dTDP-4-dehydrorhamnose 3,5-epimerase
MKISPTKLADAFVIETEVFRDKRGNFARLFCKEELMDIYKNRSIVQINYSLTREKGALRGMHFQNPPNSGAKMVRCIKGSVFDVIIDLRANSRSFLKWHGEVLSADNMKMLYIPEGFAHGFQTLETNCEMLYLHSEFYSPSHEGGVHYNDPAVNVQWPLEVTEISEKDCNYPLIISNYSGIDI